MFGLHGRKHQIFCLNKEVCANFGEINFKKSTRIFSCHFYYK